MSKNPVKKQILEFVKDDQKQRKSTYKVQMKNMTKLANKFDEFEEELIEIQDKANCLRKEIFQTYADTHFIMVENTSEEEWKPLAKQMEKFY